MGNNKFGHTCFGPKRHSHVSKQIGFWTLPPNLCGPFVFQEPAGKGLARFLFCRLDCALLTIKPHLLGAQRAVLSPLSFLIASCSFFPTVCCLRVRCAWKTVNGHAIQVRFICSAVFECLAPHQDSSRAPSAGRASIARPLRFRPEKRSPQIWFDPKKQNTSGLSP